ncbi:MAG: DNA repair protein RecO [Firmicutes bacterium HGW-Firmicutes-8]|nr:MAG: DNA repair protein RecO [Firmicutes bacterium HGW-Firmicutes-8]
MRDYKTEGIIIRVRDYNEADRIITLFTADYGKVQAIARGCRKPKSRKRGIIQLFTYGEFALYRGRNLDTITQCEGKEAFSGLREDLDRMAFGAYLVELVDGFATSGEPHGDLFYLTLVCLHLLTVEDPELVTRAFEIRIMDLMGYRPHLESCVHCGRPIGGPRVAFSSRMGGSLCEICAGHHPDCQVCSLGSLNMLKQLASWDIKRLGVLKLTGETKREIGEIMKTYISCRLDKEIKSAEFLHSLAGTQNIC